VVAGVVEEVLLSKGFKLVNLRLFGELCVLLGLRCIATLLLVLLDVLPVELLGWILLLLDEFCELFELNINCVDNKSSICDIVDGLLLVDVVLVFPNEPVLFVDNDEFV
jgi:hypothetical protein